MSPLFDTGACLRKISSSKLRASCAISIDCSLLLHQKGTFQTPPPHISFSDLYYELPLFAKTCVLLPGTARQCARVPALFCCRHLPLAACQPGAGACALPGMPMRPTSCAFERLPGARPHGGFAVRCRHGCDLCLMCGPEW